MKHVGQLLKKHIETNNIKKRDVANAVGISYNYLSTIFTRKSIDCELLEKLCKATGLSTGAFFDDGGGSTKVLSDIHQQTLVGSPTISVNDPATLTALVAEKERTIQILMAAKGFNNGTGTEQPK